MLKRTLLVAALGAALAVAVTSSDRTSPEAEAVAPADIVGVYNLRLKGDGFRGDTATDASKTERVRGRAQLVISRAEEDKNTKELVVEIHLPANQDGHLIALATPSPAFRGTGFLVGQSMTAIGTGSKVFVNAVTMRFNGRSTKVSGWWLASLADSAAAQSTVVSGLGLQFKGKRAKFQPQPLPPEPMPARTQDEDALRTR